MGKKLPQTDNQIRKYQIIIEEDDNQIENIITDQSQIAESKKILKQKRREKREQQQDDEIVIEKKIRKSKKNNEQKESDEEQEEQDIEEEEQSIKQKKKKDEKILIKSISISIPDSIIQIAQSAELRSYFISQIARTAAMFCVDEIIVLKDHSYKTKSPNFDSTAYVCRNLQNLETPQYLRKALFPIHPDLKYSGLMNPIEARHHLKFDQFLPYREGVTINRPSKPNEGSWADIGLLKHCKVDYLLQPNTRVTLKLVETSLETENKHFTGKIVAQCEPMQSSGLYWGYQVRTANHVGEVFNQSLLQSPYDLRICIGKRGNPVDVKQLQRLLHTQRVVIVFGGHEGIEPVVEGDEKSKIREANLQNHFDLYYCLNQDQYGVKALRVEEEIFMFLQILQNVYKRH